MRQNRIKKKRTQGKVITKKKKVEVLSLGRLVRRSGGPKDELRQELVGQRVKVFTVEFRLMAGLKVGFYFMNYQSGTLSNSKLEKKNSPYFVTCALTSVIASQMGWLECKT